MNDSLLAVVSCQTRDRAGTPNMRSWWAVRYRVDGMCLSRTYAHNAVDASTATTHMAITADPSVSTEHNRR
jgi:hypothetical protein